MRKKRNKKFRSFGFKFSSRKLARKHTKRTRKFMMKGIL